MGELDYSDTFMLHVNLEKADKNIAFLRRLLQLSLSLDVRMELARIPWALG